MQVLVDSSIWIDYFKDGRKSEKLDYLIDENIVVTNDLILAELIPFLRIRNQRKIVGLMQTIKKLSMDIIWDEIIESQYMCLKKGVNGIGLPDLVIAQNARQHHAEIYTLDSHFAMMKNILELELTI
ncbi:MAG: PIN domain-containing protein [Candidatus Fermentibacteria bacterium]|nr:PIN domain-containing protein [Candidatus Fermentibacteria bacterium]